ncbi:hypothetical protein JR316_0002405 [Psilocybe cubensis]|uniref:Uncharacterized protein n=2 Tax=Psilocybe cubensis TaxID=181762 RepID=A0ACB8HCW6_PSICU|nr:hypothetical protein JR316_0002405 [Psilocybe cubensis]KAH9485497.1 hypothetical protein JR316_0002405 [Psilocybe cubensis]
MSSETKARFAAYKKSLASMSARTGTPLPSLLLSFGILHELTAIVPLVGFFYGARTLGFGERVIAGVTSSQSDSSQLSWAKQKMNIWVEEGDRWAARIGRRYGVFGYDKHAPGVVDDIEEMRHSSGHIAGDVANAVFAYGATKALLPLRIGISVYFSPMFSRNIVEPIRKTVIRTFRRNL